MTEPRDTPQLSDSVRTFLSSAAFASSLTTAAIGSVVLSHLLRSVIGWPGLIAMLSGLAILCVFALLSRRESMEWQGILPLSLLTFVGWCGLSFIWSEYQWSTVSGILYQLVVLVLALFVALARDLIQIVRAFGNVLRAVLILSFSVELLSGVLIDTPLPFLGVRGDLAQGGPIQGVLGSRNMVGLVAMIAAVTFSIEYATRAISRKVAGASIAAAGIAIFLSRSPVTAGVLVIVGVATVALFGMRAARPEARRFLQIGLLIATVAVGLIGYVARGQVVRFLNAGSEFEYRYDLWQSVSGLISLNSLEGFGWAGLWRPDRLPFSAVDYLSNRRHESALNAYLDVWFQVGIVGLVAFIVLVALALGRAWIVASNRRSVVSLWTPLVLVSLLSTSAVESFVLVEVGWFTLTVCAVKAAQELSWRRRLHS